MLKKNFKQLNLMEFIWAKNNSWIKQHLEPRGSESSTQWCEQKSFYRPNTGIGR
jgi:hypothetical protein